MFFRLLGIVIVVAAAVYLAGYSKTAAIDTAIEIDAPREEVWAVLTDLPAYGEWNPFITRASGTIREGAEIQIEFAPVGDEGAMSFAPTVQDVTDNQQFSWLGRVGVPGIFDGHHQFILEEVESGRTRLVQHEDFRGLMLYFIDIARYEPSFAAMNEAVKVRAEAAAAEKARAGEPTVPAPAGPAAPGAMAPAAPGGTMMAPAPEGTMMAPAPEGTMMAPAPEGSMMAPTDGSGQMMAPPPDGTMAPAPAPAAPQ